MPKPEESKPLMGLGRYAFLSRYWLTVAWNLVPPNRQRSIFVLGHPRTGTNWLCRVLSHYFGIARYVARDRPLPVLTPVTLHLHRFVVVPSRTIYVLRDGRDISVSYYHKVVNTMAKGSEVVQALRAFCPEPLTHENVQANLPGFIRFQFEEKTLGSIPYDRHVRRAARAGYYSVRYEDLLENGDDVLSGIVRHLTAAEPDAERVRETLEATSFEKRTGRKRGQQDLAWPSVRKGIAGDWKNQFTREAAVVFDRYAGEVLVESGYEPDRSWVGRVPERPAA